MSQFIYNGEDERVVPLTGDVVKKGDTIEAPDDFSAYGFEPVTNRKSTASAVAPTPSAAPDIIVEEVK